MKQMMRELKAIAKQHGCKVRIYTYDALKKDSGYLRSFSHTHSGGEYDAEKKCLRIRKYRNTFMLVVLHTLAHEVRHMLHDAKDIYPKYYSKYWQDKLIEFNKNGKTSGELDISCFLQGVRAERDCNKWADKFLSDRGYNSKQFGKKYPADSVLGANMYYSYMNRYNH